MSFQAMSWAIEQKTGSAGAKLVLLMLANHSNGHTGQCNPKIKLIAEECEMSESTVKRHLDSLEQQGFINKESRFVEGIQISNQYWLCMGWVQKDTPRGVQNEPTVGSNWATNKQEYKPVIETESKDAGRPATRARKKSDLTSFVDWLKHCEENQEKRIPANDTIFDDGIPRPYIYLAWQVFSADMIEKGKKAKDWRAQFRTYVRKDYLKLWAINRQGEYFLTTAGKTAAYRFNMEDLINE